MVISRRSLIGTGHPRFQEYFIRARVFGSMTPTEAYHPTGWSSTGEGSWRACDHADATEGAEVMTGGSVTADLPLAHPPTRIAATTLAGPRRFMGASFLHLEVSDPGGLPQQGMHLWVTGR